MKAERPKIRFMVASGLKVGDVNEEVDVEATNV